MTEYKAISGQSIFDVCLQTYGTLDYLYKLLQDNGIESVNAPVIGGQTFQWDDSLVLDQGLNTVFTNTGVRYSTDVSQNGSVYYVLENPVRAIDNSGGQQSNFQPYLPGTSKYMGVFNTSYTATADGATSMQILDINGQPIIGFDILQVEKEIKQLKADEYTWDKNTAMLTLLNGNVMYMQETLYILYTKMIEE